MPRPPNPDVRARLLTTGSDLMHRRGFNASAVQDITEAAKVRKGSFYNYFGSKESLAVEIIEEYRQSIGHRHGPVLYDARITLALFWKRLTTAGAVAGMLSGATVAVLMIVLSPTIQVEVLHRALSDVGDKWWFVSLRNPSIISVPLAFFVSWAVSTLLPSVASQRCFRRRIR